MVSNPKDLNKMPLSDNEVAAGRPSARGKIYFCFGFFLVIFFLFFIPLAQAQILYGIVPCGTSYASSPCTVCHFYVLLQNIINFLLITSASLATLMAVYIGFLFLLSGGSPKMITDAKSKLWLLVWGIGWVLGSWLVLNTILTFLVNPKVFPMPWNQISCEVSQSSGGGSASNTSTSQVPTLPQAPIFGNKITPTNAEIQGQAAKLLADFPKSFSAQADCGNFSADATMRSVASGSLPPVCSPTCDCRTGGPSGQVNLDSRVLALTERILRTYSEQVKVTSLTTGRHGENSRHYQGRAVDFQIEEGARINYRILEATLRSALGSNSFLQCESGGKTVGCNASSVDHIHAEYQR